MTDLPPGLTTRRLERADAREVFELIAAQELADTGTIEIEEADIVGEWQRPSYDLGARSVAVCDGERIVAYAEIHGEQYGDVAVHPDHRGRGIGTWLANWTQECARGLGTTIFGMPVPEGSPGDRLLTALGYHVRWTSWVLRLPEGRTIVERPLPEGYALRTADPEDYEQVWTVVEDAFLEWSVRQRESLADFAATTWERPGFEPWNLRIVVDPDGAVVGVSHVWLVVDEAYVGRLAVRADQRGRGLAQALLVDSFAEGRARGAITSCLATDSRTGALSLYEKVGMQADSVWLHRAIALDD